MRKQSTRQVISTIFFAGSFLLAHAQVMITPQIPPTGLIKKDQLWNIVLVNNNDIPYDVQIQVSVQDIKTGEKVLTGASRLFTIGKGARQLQINDVNPVQYNYGNAAALTDRSNNGLLPIGSYQVCYTLIEQSNKSSLPSTEECIPVEIEPLSPPLLNAPANKDTVTTTAPMFQWIPPAPLTMFSDLNYDFILAEVIKGQSINEAIQKNTPIYYQNTIKTMFLAYPSSAKSLEEGKTYAWQVIAKNGNNYAEKTETWGFTIRTGMALTELKASGYPRLMQGTGALYYVFDDQLKFAYTNTTGDTAVTVNFYTANTTTKNAVYQKTIKITAGENLIQDDALSKRVFRQDALYRAEITDTKGGKWGILFKYKSAVQ